MRKHSKFYRSTLLHTSFFFFQQLMEFKNKSLQITLLFDWKKKKEKKKETMGYFYKTFNTSTMGWYSFIRYRYWYKSICIILIIFKTGMIKFEQFHMFFGKNSSLDVIHFLKVWKWYQRNFNLIYFVNFCKQKMNK